jgi:hypothetical protein
MRGVVLRYRFQNEDEVRHVQDRLAKLAIYTRENVSSSYREPGTDIYAFPWHFPSYSSDQEIETALNNAKQIPGFVDYQPIN